ncbi:hypothetical protein [Flavobacterium sp.]|nr:hypothetical protein [Flavobacterium sp.]
MYTYNIIDEKHGKLVAKIVLSNSETPEEWKFPNQKNLKDGLIEAGYIIE